MSAEERFRGVYARSEWAVGGVLSGPGSRPEACAVLGEWLQGEVDAGAASVCDLGCGDLAWISRVPAIAEGRLRYWGVDVVAALVEHHRRVFPWYRGEAGDLDGEGSLEKPQRQAEILLLKDVIFHFCNGAAGQVLLNLSRWKSWRKLLVSTHAGSQLGRRGGLRDGMMQPLDVEYLCRREGVEMGEITRRFARPDGGEWIVWERC